MNTYKIVIVGDAQVGKTTFVRKLMGLGNQGYIATLGVEVTPIRRNGVCYNIWDCGGNERFRGLGDGYWIQSNGAIVMCDTSLNSIESIDTWVRDLRRIGDFPILIVFNKSETLSKEDKEKYSKKYSNLIYISCTNDENIENVLTICDEFNTLLCFNGSCEKCIKKAIEEYNKTIKEFLSLNMCLNRNNIKVSKDMKQLILNTYMLKQ